MLELQLKKGTLFENVLEASLDLVNEASVDCSSTGFSLQAVDAKRVGMLSVLFPAQVFEHYRCDVDGSMGITIADMVKALRCANDDDIIDIKADDQNNSIALTFHSSKENSTTAFGLRLVDAKSHRLVVPEWQFLDSTYEAIFCMSSVDFMRICKSLSGIDNEVVISVTKEVVKFFACGKRGSLSIVYRQNETLGKTHYDVREPVSLTLDLSCLNSCTRAFALFDQVKIRLSTKLPMMVECKIKEKGYIRYSIAPKILTEVEVEGKTENVEEGTKGNKTMQD
ncbi:unnamed protein product [Urochloa decumbens]|uniref:DNA sliding clamp PCNA n=1 Tax=Urochloa decumbens TaxID=240449 RepID=A0ABC9CX11_9POAL